MEFVRRTKFEFKIKIKNFSVRQRKTFLRVGQSLLARKDLEMEKQLKDHMIQSVMPKKVEIFCFLYFIDFL